MLVTVYIGIGSNLSDPINQAKSAIKAISSIADTQLIKVSSFYSSKPQGSQDQPDYVNAVAKIETTLEAEALLRETQSIENKHGRVRGKERWTARTLDLDLLLYGNEIIDTEVLKVPHIWLTRRSFVVYPLAEITNDLQLPTGENIDLLSKKRLEPEIYKLD